jgi:hypothetical protein
MKLAFELPPAQAEKLRCRLSRCGSHGPDEEPRVVQAPRLIRYLTLGEVVALHKAIVETTGGATGIRDLGSLE